MRGEHFKILVAVCALLHGCSRKEDGAAGGSVAPVATVASVRSEPQAGPVAFIDGDDRPIREARIALLSREAFDDKGRLREEAVTTCPERVRILVEDAAPDAPGLVTVASLTLSLEGPPGHRQTRPFLLIGDREEAAAGAEFAVLASPRGR